MSLTGALATELIEASDWNSRPLGEIVEVLDSKRKPITKRDRVPGPYPYYGATGVLDYVDGYIFDEPLVLIGEDGAKWGAGDASAFSVNGKVWVNNHAHVLRPDRELVIDEWLIYYLNAADLSEFISGMTVPKLNQGRLKEIPIPLPPLEEQKRIVAVLDKAFAALDRASALAEANLADAQELHPSFVTSLVSKHRSDWPISRLGEVYDVRDGTHDSPKYQETGRALITSKNLGRFGLNFDKVKFISNEDYVSISKRSAVDKGDVLFAMIGTIGNPVIVDVEPDFAIKNVALFKMQNGRSGALLRHLLGSKSVQDKMAAEAKGTTQQFVGLGYLRAFELNLPKTEDEPILLAELDWSEALSRKVQNSCFEKLDDIAELRQSLLQKAFAGELA